jgi:WhiB family redox-sensing transcriptional regulator
MTAHHPTRDPRPTRDSWTLPTRDSWALNEDWMDVAACKGRTNLFFGIAGERPERRARREAQAREVCQSCPVLVQCRSLARANRENGFWGGESEEERAAAGYPPRSISRRAVQDATVRAS